MLFSVAQLAADTNDEHGTVFFGDGVFAFLGSQIGVFLQQFFRVYEVDVVCQERFDLRIHFADHVFGAAHGRVDTGYNLFQESDATLFGGDGAFPVPLVYIKGMEVAQLLIGTDGIHVGIDAIARTDVVFGQCQSFPFGQRVNHFGLGIAQILDGEGNGTFHSVQVVVDTHTLQHEERGGNTAQAQFRRQVLLEKFLDLFDAHLGLFQIE